MLVIPATPESTADALRLIFGGFDRTGAARYVDSFISAIRAGNLSREGLLEARRNGRLVGAALCQVLPGRAAVVWPPRLVQDESGETAAVLLEEIAAFLRGKDVRVANALLESRRDEDEGLLQSAGYRYLAELLYQFSVTESFPPSRPQSPVEFQSWRPGDDNRMAAVLETTYDDSLDCPGLDGLRESEDVLAGYRETGQFAPERWMFVRHEGQDVGCLLLAEHAEEEQWELVYVGLNVAARRRGWGTALVRHAQWMTRVAGRPRLVVAVDAANRPALEVYRRTGFQTWDQRHAYVNTLAEPRGVER